MSVKTRVRTSPVAVSGRYGDPTPKTPGPSHSQGIPLDRCPHNDAPMMTPTFNDLSRLHDTERFYYKSKVRVKESI
jgi:hypothetical protein